MSAVIIGKLSPERIAALKAAEAERLREPPLKAKDFLQEKFELLKALFDLGMPITAGEEKFLCKYCPSILVGQDLQTIFSSVSRKVTEELAKENIWAENLKRAKERKKLDAEKRAADKLHAKQLKEEEAFQKEIEARKKAAEVDEISKAIFWSCVSKKSYSSAKLAERVRDEALVKRGAALRVYKCDFCTQFHLTKKV